jgi:hypothetical protein
MHFEETVAAESGEALQDEFPALGGGIVGGRRRGGPGGWNSAENSGASEHNGGESHAPIVD